MEELDTEGRRKTSFRDIVVQDAPMLKSADREEFVKQEISNDEFDEGVQMRTTT
ncbi:hypothetical protein JCGZ_13597 [Jatropha curcas]|uniref:Uncharacterized protein n=1 Tax=Jatropha curcas TaxID=180498 RepID=A0A067LDS7_JATCU|nr:hypothetical protein JCGZ_13597 [Jatropha curcas]